MSPIFLSRASAHSQFTSGKQGIDAVVVVQTEVANALAQAVDVCVLRQDGADFNVLVFELQKSHRQKNLFISPRKKKKRGVVRSGAQRCWCQR